MTDEGKSDAISWGTRRSVLGENNGVENPSLILAAERTHRKDPLDDFNYYKGGWNISERHYISVSPSSYFFQFVFLFKFNLPNTL